MAEKQTPAASSRTLPYSEEAEKAVIGSILLDPKYLRKCQKADLQSEMFHVPAHRIIYDAILLLAGDSKVIDLITLTDLLKNQGKLDMVGGAIHLEHIIDATPTAAHIEHYIDIVVRKSKRRQVIALAREAECDAIGSEENEETLLTKIKCAFQKLSFVKKAKETILELAEGLVSKYNGARDTGKYGIPSRWFDVNGKLVCYMPGKISIIAGRPGKGKTTYALNEALHKALCGIPALIVSIEMSAEEVVERLICDLMDLDSKKFKKGEVTSQEIREFHEGAKVINQLPIYIEHGNFTIEQISSFIQEYYEEHGIQLAVLDYIQIVSATPHIKFQNRNAEISHMSQGLVHTANDTLVHTMVISQLKRLYVPGKGKRTREPECDDLRDSGSLEQDAFQVIFLFEDPEAETEYFMNSCPYICKIDKNRHGATGKVEMTFQKDRSKFLGNDGKTLSEMLQPQDEETPF